MIGEERKETPVEVPPDESHDAFRAEAYNRMERGAGWIFLSVGSIVLIAGGLYELAVSLLRDAADPWWVRFGVAALVVGLAVLFVSVVRERIFVFKRDPYKEVER